MRVQPLMAPLNEVDRSLLSEAMECARVVLIREENAGRLLSLSEKIYRLAASNAVRFRNDPSVENSRQSVAGVIIHSAIDCIADLDTDERAARTNAMLTLRSCGKLSDSDIENAVINDLRGCEAVDVTTRTQVLDLFGPLWPNDPPDWFVTGLDA